MSMIATTRITSHVRISLRGATLFGLLLVVLLLGIPRHAAAQFFDMPREKSLIDPQLLGLQNEFDGFAGTPDAFISRNPMLRLANGHVVIDAAASGDAETLKNDLEQLGLRQGKTFGRMVSGWLPIEAIDDLAGLSSLRLIRPSGAMTNRVGLTTSQGDASMHTDDVRNFFGIDGTGTTVGVLSDSYDFLGGAAADIASGDLPAAGVNVLDDDCCSDEGRAMLQLVHDVVPGADLAFHTAFNGQADFADGIVELATVAGADVVVDDVFYFAEPFFQDGIIAQAVDQVSAMGVPYFSSAGNSARQSYESDYRPSGLFLDIGFGPQEAHDFDPGPGVDIFQRVTFVPNIFPFSFQWDEPFFSVSGAPGSASDLDFCFYNDPPGPFPLFCAVAGNVGGDPVEAFSVFAGGTFNIAIMKFAGPDPELIKYIWFRGNLTVEYPTNSSTVVGHSNTAGGQGVGAAWYADTPAFGTAPPLPESFSSAGQTGILFDTAGNRLATPDVREKPDIVAPDGTNNTFFGGDAEPDGFPNFFGTSAAAPHAAAAAALLLEADPSLTPNDIYTLFETTAVDMDDPFTGGFDTGFDEGTGHGLINILNIFTDLDLDKDLVSIVPNNGSVTGTFVLSITNNGPGDASGVAVTDIVPAGATFVSATPSQGAYDELTGLWTVGDLANGASATLTVTLTAGSDDAFFNIAEVTDYNGLDMQPSNNIAADRLGRDLPDPKRFRADLSLQKTVDNDTPATGTEVTYTLTLRNHGPVSTAGVEVSDLLPAGLSFVSANASQGTYDNTSGTWTVGSLKDDQTVTLEITVEVTATGPITNTAEVSASTLPDPDSQVNNNLAIEDDQDSATLTATAAQPRVEASPSVPKEVELGSNYPNPFNPETVIPFGLPEEGHVRVSVYDVLGRLVTTLVDGVLSAGRHEVVFRADRLPTGVYLVRMEVSGEVRTQRVTLMK